MGEEGLPLIGPIQDKMQQVGLWVEETKKKQGLAARIALGAIPSALQGCVFGYLTHMITKNSAKSATSSMAAMPAEQRAQMAKMAEKTLPETIRPLVALFVVQSGLTEALNHYRKNKDDVWQAAIPALGAGTAYALASGTPGQAPAMGLGFAAFSALFWKMGWGATKPDPNIPAGMTQKQWKDSQYQASLSMLTFLGLQNYHQNLKRGLLTDNTIMLWNDSVLQEIKIPPGPRLLILHHLKETADRMQPRNKVLSPSHPIEGLPVEDKADKKKIRR